jgi:hypothetical protein
MREHGVKYARQSSHHHDIKLRIGDSKLVFKGGETRTQDFLCDECGELSQDAGIRYDGANQAIMEETRGGAA